MKKSNKECRLLDTMQVTRLTQEHRDRPHIDALLSIADDLLLRESFRTSLKPSDSEAYLGWIDTVPCVSYVTSPTKRKKEDNYNNHNHSTNNRNLPFGHHKQAANDMIDFSDWKSGVDAKTYRYMRNNAGYRTYKMMHRHINESQKTKYHPNSEKELTSEQFEMHKEIKRELQRELQNTPSVPHRVVHPKMQFKHNGDERKATPPQADVVPLHPTPEKSLEVPFVHLPQGIPYEKLEVNSKHVKKKHFPVQFSMYTLQQSDTNKNKQRTSKQHADAFLQGRPVEREQHTLNKIKEKHANIAVELPPIEQPLSIDVVRPSKIGLNNFSNRISIFEAEMKKDKYVLRKDDSTWGSRNFLEPSGVFMGNFMDLSCLPQFSNQHNTDLLAVKPAVLPGDKRRKGHRKVHQAAVVPGFHKKEIHINNNKTAGEDFEFHEHSRELAREIESTRSSPVHHVPKTTKSKRSSSSTVSHSNNSHHSHHSHHSHALHSGGDDIVNFVRDMTRINKVSSSSPAVIVRAASIKQGSSFKTKHSSSDTKSRVAKVPKLPKPEHSFTDDIVSKVTGRSLKASAN